MPLWTESGPAWLVKYRIYEILNARHLQFSSYTSSDNRTTATTSFVISTQSTRSPSMQSIYPLMRSVGVLVGGHESTAQAEKMWITTHAGSSDQRSTSTCQESRTVGATGTFVVQQSNDNTMKSHIPCMTRSTTGTCPSCILLYGPVLYHNGRYQDITPQDHRTTVP